MGGAKIHCRSGSICNIICRNSGCQHYGNAVDFGIICPEIVDAPLLFDSVFMSVGQMVGAQEMSSQLYYGYVIVFALLTMTVLAVYKACYGRKGDKYVAI